MPRPAAEPELPPRSPWGAGLLAGTWAVVFGYVPLAVIGVVAWAVAPDAPGDPQQALKTAGLAWTMTHFGAVSTPDGLLRLAPLGLTICAGLLLVRAGVWAARSAAVRNLREATAVAGTLALTYTGTGLLLAAFSSTDTARALPAQLALGALGTAAVAGTIGVVRGAGLTPAITRQLSPTTTTLLRAGLLSTTVMLAAGAALTSLALLARFGRVRDLTEALTTDPFGGAVVALLGVMLVPNAVVWVSTVTLGTGFALGQGTNVAPGGVSVETLPVIPMLGAVPDPGDLPGLTIAVVLVPVVAGVLVARNVERLTPRATVLHRMQVSVGACALGGILLGFLALLSSGSLGDGRLSEIGPPVLVTTVVATAIPALVAALTVWEWPRLRSRLADLRPAVTDIRPKVLDLRDRIGAGLQRGDR